MTIFARRLGATDDPTVSRPPGDEDPARHPSASWDLTAFAAPVQQGSEIPAFAGMTEGAVLSESDDTLALYVHWPFCVSKCPYCDFNSHVRGSVDQEIWREALLADLAHEARLTPGRRLGSIFFGGGTPSLMPPATVTALIEAAQAHWGFAPGIEITLEANPSSVEAARFADLAAAGVNREIGRAHV